jgi:hypothetical protein
MLQVLEAVSHSGVIEVTCGMVEVYVNLQLSANVHLASSDVFKKTTSFPSSLFGLS